MITILITGINGLLGQTLVALYGHDASIKLIATARGINKCQEGNYEFAEMDVTDSVQIEKVFDTYRPNIIIHTAAMTQVDECESKREECLKINVKSVEYLVRACEQHQTFFIHLSTDFVFDGKDGPYDETIAPNPLSHYGLSKLKSEQVLMQSNIKWAIARTMLVYGVLPDLSRSNIVLWIKESLEQGKKISVVNDQWRMPTLVESLAEGCQLIAKKRKTGIFHLSGSTMLSPYEMALIIAKKFQLDSKLIQEVDGSLFKQKASRPSRTGFVLDKAINELNYHPIGFEEGLEKVKKLID